MDGGWNIIEAVLLLPKEVYQAAAICGMIAEAITAPTAGPRWMEVLTMTLREKLMHYTNDLGCGVDLKQEAIATIEHIAQYMDEDELLHHSRPLALAYLALTEDASAPVVHTRWAHLGGDEWCCPVCGFVITTEGSWDKPTKKYCEDCGAKMDGGADHV